MQYKTLTHTQTQMQTQTYRHTDINVVILCVVRLVGGSLRKEHQPLLQLIFRLEIESNSILIQSYIDKSFSVLGADLRVIEERSLQDQN